MKEQLEGAIDGDDELTIRTELVGVWVSTAASQVIGMLGMLILRSMNK